ncbi:MAG: haloacid dehalogenase-like hydrolase [Planctomycetota bacterium]
MKACLLDIDGTLVLTGGAGQEAFAESFDALFDVGEITADVSFAGRSDRAIALDLMRHHGVDPSPENWDAFQSAYVERLGPALQRCTGQVLPGVFEFLDKLAARGDVLIGLLTGNMFLAAMMKLHHYGLWDRFTFGGFGDRYADRNDIAATAVSEAEKRYDGDSNGDSTVVVIGDTPNDVRCARSVGAIAVAVPTGHTSAAALRSCGPDLLVETLEDHDTILQWFE